MLRVASVFSGGFGSTIFAFKYENIDFEEVFAVEWMKPQRKSHILNHGMPTSAFYEDATQFDAKKYKGQIDLLQLSPPCQSYSLAGNRGGAADNRGDLMFRAIEIIDHVQPKQFFIENVKGLLSSNGGEDWKNILRDVRSLKGYTVTWGVMNAKDQGTPQNRERVFIVGFRGECMPMPFPKRIKLDKCLADVLEEVVDEKYYLSDKMMSGFIKTPCNGNKIGYINQNTQASQIFSTEGISPSLCAGTHGYANGYIMELNQIGSVGGDSAKKHNSAWARVYDINGIAPTQIAKGGGGGAKTGLFLISSNTKSGYEEARIGDGISISRPTSTTRRGRVGKKVAQTLDTSSSQGVLKNGRIKKLTPREGARVMGDFQDMFKFGEASDTKLYEFIGNAMDISTTRNLLKAMFAHKVKVGEPLEPSFVRKEVVKSTLF